MPLPSTLVLHLVQPKVTRHLTKEHAAFRDKKEVSLKS